MTSTSKIERRVHRLVTRLVDAGAASRQDEVDELVASADRLLVELIETKHQLEALESADVLAPTVFGACPMKPGGTSARAAAGVVERWGVGAAVRQFYGDLEPIHFPDGASRVHASFKIDKDDTAGSCEEILSGSRDEELANIVEGHDGRTIVELIHEADKKVTDGRVAFEVVVAAKNRFRDVVKLANPDVLVANTLTGWLADPKSGKDLDRWGEVRADVLGLDLDAVVPKALPYPDFNAEIVSGLAFVHRFAGMGYRWLAFPELGAPRIPEDTDGSARAAWLHRIASASVTAGVLYATLYEYDSTPGYALHGDVELEAWRQLVAAAGTTMDA